jgi:hypothetical protein
MQTTLDFMKTGHIDYAEIDGRVAYYRPIPFKA